MSIVLAGAITGYILGQGNSNQAKIKEVITEFAAAVDEVNIPKVVELLCPEEAAGITDNPDTPASSNRLAVHPRAITVSNVKIKGNIASVLVTRPGQNPVTMYLRMEKGNWKVCAPAAGTTGGQETRQPRA
jgi:hypothetical protein